MNSTALDGMRIAVLATDGFEQSELMLPRQTLLDAGAQVQIVSPKHGQIHGWQKNNWGESISVDVMLDQANPDDFDALVLPGGVANPDQLRIVPQAVSFVRTFVVADKPIAAIGHGPWMLVEAGAVRGRTVTSWTSLKTDIINAGGSWVDEEVRVDDGIITSRKPDDIPAFSAKMIEVFSERRHHISVTTYAAPVQLASAPGVGLTRE
jgi:protease I